MLEVIGQSGLHYQENIFWVNPENRLAFHSIHIDPLLSTLNLLSST